MSRDPESDRYLLERDCDMKLRPSVRVSRNEAANAERRRKRALMRALGIGGKRLRTLRRREKRLEAKRRAVDEWKQERPI